MRAAIFGTGALGTALGALLVKGGEKIDFIDSDKTQIEAFRSGGARMEGANNFTVPVNALYPEEATPGYDVILLCTGEHDNAVALPRVKELLADNGVLVSFHNGFTDFEVVDAVGASRMMGCAVDWTAALKEPGCVVLKPAGDILRAYIGKMPGVSSSAAMNARNLIGRIGHLHFITNLLGSRWGKLVINCSLSAVSTIYGGTFGEAISDDNCRELIVMAANECMKVADAKDIKVPNFDRVNFEEVARYRTIVGKRKRMEMLPELIGPHKDNRSILLQDMENGKPLDLEYITGVIIKSGGEGGVPTPVVSKLQETLLGIEKKQIPMGPETIAKVSKAL